MNIQFFLDKLISQSSSKPLIVRSFYLLRMSDDYCFRRAVQCNWRNTATVLRAVVKSHNGLKGTKVFACGCSGRNLNNLSKFGGKSPCWGLFVVKLQPVVAYQRLLGQFSQKRNAYTETLLRVSEESQSVLTLVSFTNNRTSGNVPPYFLR